MVNEWEKDEKGWYHPEIHLLGAILHANQSLMSLFSREVGVTPAKLRFLHEFLHTDRKGISLVDLSLRLGVTPALITRQVKELEREGLLERQSDPRDARSSLIKLTLKGESELLKHHKRAHQLEDALIANMNPDDIATTVNLLKALSEKLESWRKTGRFIMPVDKEKDMD